MPLKVGGQKERNRSHIFVLNLSSNMRFRRLVLVVFEPFPPHIRSIGKKDDGILRNGSTGNRIASVAEWSRHLGVWPCIGSSGDMVKCDTVGYIRLTDLAGSLEVVRRQF
jgi:hypothetical protein